MADEAKGKEPQQKEESAAPKKKVTSQMLPNKFQRDQERRQYREESARRHEGDWRCPFLCVLLGGRLDSANSGQLSRMQWFLP